MLLLEIPYLIRIFVSLALILVLNKVSRKLMLSMVGGTLLLAIWCGHGLHDIAKITVNHVMSDNTFFLMIVVMQVIWLSSQMSKTGSMRNLVESVKGLLPLRVTMALLPAVIGLLPMPGGAIFSAPLVDDADEKKELSPVLKTQINYWFRHLWEYWWPLYPGVILAIQLTGLSELIFVALGLPLSILSVSAGYFFLLRKIPHQKARKSSDGNWFRLLKILSPIFILIGVYIVTTFLTRFIFAIESRLPAAVEILLRAKYFPMIVGIGAAQIYLQFLVPLNRKNWKEIFLTSSTFNLAVTVLAVTVYGAFVQSDLPQGGKLMEVVREELMSFGIPIITVIMAVPFIAGMTTGLAIGMVGASFPVVMGLIGDNPAIRELLSTTLLAYAMGYMGMILSPVHVCLIVTNKHFKTSISESLLKLTKPALAVTSGALLLYMIIRYI